MRTLLLLPLLALASARADPVVLLAPAVGSPARLTACSSTRNPSLPTRWRSLAVAAARRPMFPVLLGISGSWSTT